MTETNCKIGRVIPKLRAVENIPNQEIIELLAGYQSEAEAGQLISVAVVAMYRGGKYACGFHKPEGHDGFAMAGMLQRVQNSMVGRVGD